MRAEGKEHHDHAAGPSLHSNFPDRFVSAVPGPGQTQQPAGATAVLVLDDGSVFWGHGAGATGSKVGEVCFNTSMTGYQEVLTDPSYAGQIVTMTYPLVGNYGINAVDVESRQVQVRGFVVREVSQQPSHWQSVKSLHDYLAENNIVGISGLDTRALTRRIRTHGVMLGTITADESPNAALERLRSEPGYEGVDFVQTVTTAAPYPWTPGDGLDEQQRPLIVVLDTGLKYNILRSLRAKGCRVVAMPSWSSADEVLALQPAGVMLSPGPGDPALLEAVVGNVRQLIGRVPLMGICLGNQLTARALGGDTFKLKFGHRGANHPVKDLLTGQVHITSQNHGYSVDAGSLPGNVEVTHVSLNDGTVEGLRHRDLPVMTIQYHSEASPGPRDNMYIFDRFLEMVKRE